MLLRAVKMADAAFAQNIPGGFDIAAGYYGGPLAYHVWSKKDWDLFPGFRLPIWVAGYDGEGEANDAVSALQALNVPEGSITVVDMETRRDRTYLQRFDKTIEQARATHEAHSVAMHTSLSTAGYRVWVYGSRDTVFGNPELNGYWVAEYGLSMSQAMQLLHTKHVRALQFEANLPPGYDGSIVREWTESEMWRGRAA